MMKKALSILLCTCVLFAFVPAAFAASAITSQDFEGYQAGSTPSITSGEGCLGVFDKFYKEGAAVTIQNDGYKGNCLHIKENDASGFTFRFYLNPEPTAGNPVHVSFKLKILNDAGFFDIANGSTRLAVLNPEKNQLLSHDTAQSIAYKLDQWYDVYIVQTDTQTTLTITDGTETITTARNANSYLTINNRSGYGVGAAADTEIAIDEIRILSVDASAAPKLISTSHSSEEPTQLQPLTKIFEDKMNDVAEGETLVNKIALNEGYVRYNNNTRGDYLWGNINKSGDKATLEQISDGKNGYALQLTNKSNNVGQIKPVTLNEGEPVYYAMKFKVVSLGNSSFKEVIRIASQRYNENDPPTAFDIGGNIALAIYANNNGFSTSSGAGTYPYNKDWYTVVFKYLKTEGSTTVTAAVYDSDNKEVFSTSKPNYEGICSLTFGNVKSDTAGVWAVDDFMVIKEPAVVEGTPALDYILSGKEYNPTAAAAASYSTSPVINLQFDSPVKGDITIKNGDTTVYTKDAGEKATVILTPEELAFGTDYSIDLSALTSISGAPANIAAIPLKTAELKNADMTVSAPAITTIGGRNVMKVPVRFGDSGTAGIEGTVIAALYAGDCLQWVGSAQISGAAPDTDKTLTFAGVPENSETFTLKLFVFSGWNTLRPVFTQK